MPGFSITLLRLPMEIPPNEGITPSSDLILSLLDAQPAVPGWHWSAASPPASAEHQLIVPTVQAVETAHEPYIPLCIASADFLIRVERACNALISAEPEITRLDSITGDGDCGLTLKVSPNSQQFRDHSSIFLITCHNSLRAPFTFRKAQKVSQLVIPWLLIDGRHTLWLRGFARASK